MGDDLIERVVIAHVIGIELRWADQSLTLLGDLFVVVRTVQDTTQDSGCKIPGLRPHEGSRLMDVVIQPQRRGVWKRLRLRWLTQRTRMIKI